MKWHFLPPRSEVKEQKHVNVSLLCSNSCVVTCQNTNPSMKSLRKHNLQKLAEPTNKQTKDSGIHEFSLAGLIRTDGPKTETDTNQVSRAISRHKNHHHLHRTYLQGSAALIPNKPNQHKRRYFRYQSLDWVTLISRLQQR